MKNGDVTLHKGKIPEVYWNGQWSPICGHYFWDNNVGVNLFCQKLGFSSGVVRRTRTKLKFDAIRIGKCRATDHWLNCTGGCNDLAIGGRCFINSNAKCTVGQPSGIT